MKKLLLFFSIFLIFGCESVRKSNDVIDLINCPNVFFSSENSSYASGNLNNLDLSSIDYKATLNNFSFLGNCYSDYAQNYYELNLLIIVEPINPKNKEINLPIFAILYDNESKIIDRQYFRINNNINYNPETAEYQVTDVISSLDIKTKKDVVVSSITIGFIKIKD